MATNFPTSVDSLVNPVSNDSLNSPSHSAQHTNANDAIEAVEDYLLNGAGRTGLVLIKSETVGTAVSSVTLSDVFSATYGAYRIVVSAVDATNVTANTIKFGAATTNYFSSQYYDSFVATTNGIDRNNNTAAYLYIGVTAQNDDTNVTFDLGNPFLTKRTTVAGNYFGNVFTGFFGGTLADTTSYTSCTIGPATGTFTGGKISVYGYAGS
jgi:hypothetical protein